MRQSLKLLRRVFPFATRRIGGQKRATLHYHLGLDPGLEEGKTTLEDYRANLRKLMAVIQGKRKTIEQRAGARHETSRQSQGFEAAAQISQSTVRACAGLNQQVIFSDKEFLDISKDHALNELVNLLSIDEFPQADRGI